MTKKIILSCFALTILAVSCLSTSPAEARKCYNEGTAGGAITTVCF